MSLKTDELGIPSSFAMARPEYPSFRNLATSLRCMPSVGRRCRRKSRRHGGTDKGFEKNKPPPSSQAPSIRLRRSDMGGMATISGGSAVLDGAFATHVPHFGLAIHYDALPQRSPMH